MSELTDLSELELEEDTKPLWKIKYESYTYHLFDTKKALIFKGDDEKPAYEINEYGCNCPSRTYRAMPCKHEKVLEWLGEGTESEPEELVDADWLS
jgi:hypothetical protein